MSRILSIRPSLEHVKNEAKSLLKSQKKGDPSVCPVFRHLKRFEAADDAEILTADIRLAEAQFALARDYGFKSWDALSRRVRLTQPVEGSQALASSDAILLPNPPVGRSGNPFASAYQMALSYCGVGCDYDTLAGDSGLAFILQGDSKNTPYGADVKVLDLGYWPLASWGAMLRLDFLGRVYGVEFHRLGWHPDEYRADAAAHYRKYYEAEIVRSLQAGRPAVALAGDTWLVTGCDHGTPPLLGQLSCKGESQIARLGKYPWDVVTLGMPGKPMDRAQADAEALAFVVDLHHDRFDRGFRDGPGLDLAGRSSGRASFALWAELLRDGERCGPAHYSANIIGCALRNRASAPPYLRQMAQRHSPAAAAPLHAAAKLYENVIAKLATADLQLFSTAAGREKLAALVEEIAEIESKAVNELVTAVKAMGRPLR